LVVSKLCQTYALEYCEMHFEVSSWYY